MCSSRLLPGSVRRQRLSVFRIPCRAIRRCVHQALTGAFIVSRVFKDWIFHVVSCIMYTDLSVPVGRSGTSMTHDEKKMRK